MFKKVLVKVVKDYGDGKYLFCRYIDGRSYGMFTGDVDSIHFHTHFYKAKAFEIDWSECKEG